MGIEASRPVQPPDDWEPEGARRSFEIISPVSDISNPSEMRGARHHRAAVTTARPTQAQRLDQRRGLEQQHRLEQKQLQPLKAVPNNRRVSRTITTSLPVKKKSNDKKSHDDDRVIVRKSSSSTDLPAPTAFYFPTKETERHAERRATTTKRASSNSVSRKTTKTMTRFFSQSKDKQQQRNSSKEAVSQSFYDLQLKQKGGLIKKTLKKTQKAMASCLEDASHLDEAPDQYKSSNLQGSRTMEPPVGVQRGEKHYHTLGLVVAKKRSSKLLPIKNDGKNHETATSNKQNDDLVEVSGMTTDDDEARALANDIDSIALHQEEAYFERLSLSREGSVEASPFVHHAPSNRILAILEGNAGLDGLLESTSKMRTSRPSEQQSMSFSTASDLFSASSSIPDNSNNILSKPSKHHTASPVSSLLRFYTDTGPMEKSPQHSYHSEPTDSNPSTGIEDDKAATPSSSADPLSNNRMKTTKEQAPQAAIIVPSASKKRESVDSHSSLYTCESTVPTNDGKAVQTLLDGDQIRGENSGEILDYYQPAKEKGLSSTLSRKTMGDKDPLRQVAALRPTEGNNAKNVSKLESLFRPVLSSFSSDDAQSVTSYNPFEIKVTESAPAGLPAIANHILLAPRQQGSYSSCGHKQLDRDSPSVLSLDTQREQSPSLAKVLVSNQATCNGEFLFSSKSGQTRLALQSTDARDSSSLSISTAGARSRLTQRSTREKAVIIPMEQSNKNIAALDARRSNGTNGSYKSERRVRFSEATIEDHENRLLSNVSTSETDTIVPSIQQTVSDLTDIVQESVDRRSSGIMSARSSLSEEHDIVSDEDTRIVSPVESTATSNFFRSTNSEVEHPFESTEDIKTKMSDLTEDMSVRRISESTFGRSVPESVPEEEEQDEDDEEESVAVSSEGSVHWIVSDNGVTPFVKGRCMKNATKSPLKRFKKAKQSFDTRNGMSVTIKTSSSSGGIVAARVEELNARVTEIRKIKKMQKKMINPRLHMHKFDNKQPVRSRALTNYKTKIASADLGKSNSFMAAKFNAIPEVEVGDDEASALSTPSSLPSIRESQAFDEASDIRSFGVSTAEREENDVDDEMSKLSEATLSVATVRQERTGPRPRMYSESTTSTGSSASSGFSNVRKQVFPRTSEGTRSLNSNGGSTTLSAILQKENARVLPFRAASNTVKPNQQNLHAPPATLYLSPTQRTPSQAMKWRTLAAAAQKKDAQAASSKPVKRGLGIRSNSHLNLKA